MLIKIYIMASLILHCAMIYIMASLISHCDSNSCSCCCHLQLLLLPLLLPSPGCSTKTVDRPKEPKCWTLNRCWDQGNIPRSKRLAGMVLSGARPIQIRHVHSHSCRRPISQYSGGLGRESNCSWPGQSRMLLIEDGRDLLAQLQASYRYMLLL